MKYFKVTIILLTAFSVTSLGFAQIIEDVEPKPYGAYAGGKIDTVDLATGNLFLNIPLISYPQLGRLPPLTFAIGLNNAPYKFSLFSCDSNDVSECQYSPIRFDPSPPGGVSSNWINSGSLQDAKIGAYLTSSFEGGIVFGEDSNYNIGYSLFDAGGTAHELASDNLNHPLSWNTYHSTDGAGYTFAPSYTTESGDSAYDDSAPSNINFGSSVSDTSWSYWIKQGITYPDEGIRAGTLFSPTGIQYTNQFVDESQYLGQNYSVPVRLLSTTESDTSGMNKITRGPWYWTGTDQTPSAIAAFYGVINPVYLDSQNHSIPDVISLQETVLGQTGQASSLCPNLVPFGGQPAVASLNWAVPGPGGSTLHYLICYTELNLSYTPFSSYSPPMAPLSIWMTGYAIQSIVLPDQTSYWGFLYDQSMTGTNYCAPSGYSPCGSGDLLQILLPTGGSISYTYGNVDIEDGRCGLYAICHAVHTRTENDGYGHDSTTTYNYASVPGTENPPANTPLIYTTTEIKPSGTSIVHTFSALGSDYSTPMYVSTDQLFEVETDYYPSAWTGSGDPRGQCTLTSGCLKSVQTIYNNNNPTWDLPVLNGSSGGNASRIINAVPTQVTTVNPANNAVVTDNRTYSTLFNGVEITCLNGCNSVQLNVDASGTIKIPNYSPAISFISPTQENISGPNGYLKTTQSSYEFGASADTAYKSDTSPALPKSVATTDSTGVNTYSKTTYNYDTAGVGNLTSVSKWLNPTGQNVTTSTLYNNLNEPYLSQDAMGNQTYTSAFQCSGLFPQTVTVAYGNSTTLPETTNYAYDCYTGAMTGKSDPNSTQTNYIYTADPLGRLTQVQYGIGNTPLTSPPATELSMTKVNYQGLDLGTVAQDQVALNDGKITNSILYDGLGRTIQQTNPAGYITSTSYNPDGEVASVTNPEGIDSVYGTSSSYEGTNGTTSYSYDALGRVIEETEQDGNKLWWCYNGILDSVHPQPTGLCSANPSNTNSGGVSWVDSLDENGNHHQQIYNALDQLIAVIEPNPQTNALALETDYSYDPNSNLSSVNQIGTSGETPRIRTFNYDSLSRLLCASNPENSTAQCPTTATGTYVAGTTGYMYDLNGNLLSKTDAGGLTTSYTYDGLNRLLSKSDPSGAPWSCYQYDNATGGIGRLGNQWTQNGGCSTSPGSSVPTLTAITAYDAMGRVKSEQQCVLSNCSTDSQLPTNYTTYNYDLAGNLTLFGDGIGTRYFTKQYDNATRLQTMTATTGSNVFTLFSAQGYGASGGVTSALYGAASPGTGGAVQTRTYDSHLRITSETDAQN